MNKGSTLGRALVLVVLLFTVCSVMTVVHAQWGRWGGFREGTLPPRFPPSSFPDRDFAFCKLMYDSVRYEELGMGWATDYPYDGINLITVYYTPLRAHETREDIGCRLQL